MIEAMNPVDEVLATFGPAVLLDWPCGLKGDSRVWKHRTLDAQTDARLAELTAHVAAGGNLGIATGSVSKHLVSVDTDSEEDMQTFDQANPSLATALRTRGARGCQLWLRILGDYPSSCDIKDALGKKHAEWRAEGRQSIVHGVHPSGVRYRRFLDGAPLTVTYASINWPVGWLPPGTSMPEPMRADLRTDKSLAPDGLIILPSGEVGILKCAHTIFSILARTRRVFTRGGMVVEVVTTPTGPNRGIALEPVHPAGFRSRLENCGAVMAWRKGRNGGEVLQPTTCPEDMARALLASEPALDILPPISAVTGCPIAIEDVDGNLQILARGYHAERGGLLVTAGTEPPRVDVDEAVDALSGLLTEFDFQTVSDASRALAAFVSPAMSLGGHIKGRVPADVAEADQSQAGKGYRQKVLAAIYNESPRVVAQRDGGVGSLDESFSQALIAGRPFIQLDNLRGALNSPFLESFLTADCIGARVPHRGEVPVDPTRFFVLASSNGVEATRDLANRSAFVRIRKREGFQFKTYPEGSLLEHVKVRQPYYLGCVFSIIAEWLAAGKPRTLETRHDFREWAQVLDWIVQRLFKAAPLLDGHLAAQERVSNPALVFLRALCLAAEQDRRGDEDFSASSFAELAEVHGIAIPGLRAGQEERAAKQVGIHLARLFKAGEEIEVDGFKARRSERMEVRQDGNGTYPVKTYAVERI